MRIVQALRKIGCPRYRRTPGTLARPLATVVTLASIQLASGGLVELMARFPLLRACDRCGFGERTFAGTRGSDGNAPIADVPALTEERGGSTLCCPSDRPDDRAGSARKRSSAEGVGCA